MSHAQTHFEPIKFQNKSFDTSQPIPRTNNHLENCMHKIRRAAHPFLCARVCVCVLWRQMENDFWNSVVVACRLIYANRLLEMTSSCLSFVTKLRWCSPSLSLCPPPLRGHTLCFHMLIGQAVLAFGTLIIRVTRHFDQINWLSQMYNENIRLSWPNRVQPKTRRRRRKNTKRNTKSTHRRSSSHWRQHTLTSSTK